MADGFSNLITQLRALPPARQALLGVTSAVSLAFLFWLVTSAAAPDYQVLYRGLDAAEAAQVAESLRTEGLDYRLADGGTSVLVQAGQLPEARIRVAGRGLPGSGAGFELFDKPAFGVTDFVHRVNYARAVQGELARSIEQLEPVRRARVQLVIPDRKSVLRATERRPSASVVLGLRPGREMTHPQVRAVVHLVASSVESLAREDVTVVDDGGRLLAPLGDEPRAGELAAGGAPAYQKRVEGELAERIESILGKTVGAGAVVARVRADMDWTQRETTEELYDPDSQVARSEQRSSETSSDSEAVQGGIPGIVANGPGAPPVETAAAGAGSNAERTSETINYEISKTVSRQLTPMGEIERLSVAVLVADPVSAAGTEGDAEAEPWDAASLALFESLAKQAVGFSEKRGDQITVRSAPFLVPEAPAVGGGPLLAPEWVFLLSTLARGAAVLIALLLFARLVVRPTLTTLSEGGAPQVPARVSDVEADLAGGALQAGAIGAVPERANVRTEEGVRTLRNWLNQG